VFDSCTDGSCHPGQPKFCDDFKVCTQDSCDPATGACLNQPASGPCSDGSFCTVGDTCDQGVCRPGTAPNCDDGNACTTDGCSASSGCFHTVLTGACDDGNPCTTGDRCLNGACKPTDPVGCVDGNLCTVDFCDRASGACVHEASSADCSDGNACTIDLCDAATGTCTGQEPLDCDDASDCTLDTCDPASGCHHEADLILCPQNVVDIALSFTSDTGKGSGTLIWSTTYEWSIGGFNVVAFNQQGVATRLNTDPIPCTACNTGAGVAYEFILGKHKSGRDLFVELLGSDGSVLGTFGPASKMAR
jgi:hypothetical protein